MKVYAHESWYCKYESDWMVEKIYKTKRLAYEAMRKRLISYYNEIREEWYCYGRECLIGRGYKGSYKEFYQ